MVRAVSIIVIVALLSSCAHNLVHYRHYEKTGVITISARVGETIEPEERVQYGLFPGVDLFKSAVFYGIAGGGYELWIKTENKSLVSVNRDSLGPVILQDYFDRYEEIKDSRGEFERKWKIIDYDDLGLAITKSELYRYRKSVSGMPISGEVVGGAIGCAGGFLVFLALAELIGERAEINPHVGDVLFFSGWALSTVAGVYLGRRLTRGSAVEAIKRSREPRTLD